MAEERYRPAWAEIDVGALQANASLLRRVIAPSALCAVVKADGYGHGAVTAARAALAGGAVALAVALVEEGVVLREAGIADPILVLGEPPSLEAAEEVAARGLEPTVFSKSALERVRQGAYRAGTRVAVHLKVDTGMHRLGASPHELMALAEEVAASQPPLVLASLWTHLAVAEEESPDARAFTAGQLERFEAARQALSAAGLEPPLLHAANSAGALVHPTSRYRASRCGIALYGLSPSEAATGALAGAALRPAMSLKARVAAVRRLPAGARPSYGRCRPLESEAIVATVPVGYADGVPRALYAAGGEVLAGGRRRPLAGMVTMDHVVVDCGAEGRVEVGDEVVLLGRQGSEEITAEEWASRLGTIHYEVVTGVGSRVPRVPVGRLAPEAPTPPGGEDRRGRWSRWMREARLR